MKSCKRFDRRFFILTFFVKNLGSEKIQCQEDQQQEKAD